MYQEDYLNIYLNYLFSLQEREKHGDKYGDTKELIEIYEEKLEKVLVRKKDESEVN